MSHKHRFTAILPLTLLVLAVPIEARAGAILFARNLTPDCGDVVEVLGIIREKTFKSVCNLDIQFTVSASGGTRFENVFEKVTNVSGQDWFDYHLELGFDTGANFKINKTPDSLVFGIEPAPTSSAFHTLSRGDNNDSLNWSNGLQRNTSAADYTFTMNIPDFNTALAQGAETECPKSSPAVPVIVGPCYVFTLRQTPSIPEPSTMMLLGSGLVAVWRTARKRRQTTDTHAD